jgi:hypothetical protein
MEPDLGPRDRAILEDYVDGFATRITELDALMLHQSKVVGGSAAGSTASGAQSESGRRSSSGIIGLVGHTGVDLGSLALR